MLVNGQDTEPAARPAMTLRGTALIDAPARTVAAALAEPWLARDRVAPYGVRIDAAAGQLGAGGRLVVRLPALGPLRPTVPLRLVRADGHGFLAVTTGGRLPALTVSATVAGTGAGTLLTYSVGWTSPGGVLGRVADVVLVRRAVLRVLAALLDGVRDRAEQLAGVPVVVGAVIVTGGRVLAAQRDRPPHAAGRWEFPGGRLEAGETECEAVARECREELAAEVVVGDRVGPDVVLPSGWLLRLHAAELAPGAEPVAAEHRALRWVPAGELADLDWLAADRLVLPEVRALLTG